MIFDIDGAPRISFVGWYIRDAQRHEQAPRLTPFSGGPAVPKHRKGSEDGDDVGAPDRFDNSVIAKFGLPRRLP